MSREFGSTEPVTSNEFHYALDKLVEKLRPYNDTWAFLEIVVHYAVQHPEEFGYADNTQSGTPDKAP